MFNKKKKINQLPSCADSSRAISENIIGSASIYQVYVLLECPTPWESDALTSPQIPQSVRELPDRLYAAGHSIRFLLIHNHRLKRSDDKKRVLIFRRQDGWFQEYDKQEFLVDSLEAVPAIVEVYLSNPRNNNLSPVKTATRDLLVCTHGSHDRCCARYGKPFYCAANKLVKNLELENVRVWQTSHFGGHRFAPTVIDFPSGRYYGGIDLFSLGMMLQRSTNCAFFKSIYRGWGVLPNAVQVLEQELILSWGWDWFDNEIKLPVSVKCLNETEQLVDLWYKKPDGTVGGYRSQIVQDPSQTVSIRGSCASPKISTFIKWQVANLMPLVPERILSK